MFMYSSQESLDQGFQKGEDVAFTCAILVIRGAKTKKRGMGLKRWVVRMR